jgi:hypothetical protein
MSACSPSQIRYAAPATLTARNAGSEAASSAAIPTAEASVQVACPHETPSAVKMPARRPPISELRIVSAVSGPGVTITIADTPRNAARSVTRRVSQFRIVAPGCGRDGR